MEQTLNFQIYQTLHSISRNMHHLAHYIGHQQGDMQQLGRSLNFINDHKNVTAKDIAAFYNIKSSSATVKVNKLVEEGYVEKTRDTKDLKVYFLNLTEKGIKKCDAINQDTTTLVEDLFDDLTENQKRVLFDELQLIEHRLESKKNNQTSDN